LRHRLCSMRDLSTISPSLIGAWHQSFIIGMPAIKVAATIWTIRSGCDQEALGFGSQAASIYFWGHGYSGAALTGAGGTFDLRNPTRESGRLAVSVQGRFDSSRQARE
jgi:hypothetical protein